MRYNRSTILGRSDRYDEKNDPQHIKWLGQTDEQTDDKVTWQLALKKQFNDHFTMRATGGTYYRLLNMYEIAGDGAGILPMPNVGGTASVFPMPEEGKQWDISAIWDGKWLGTDTAKFQLTYFGRDSKRLLQLSSWNSFFLFTIMQPVVRSMVQRFRLICHGRNGMSICRLPIRSLRILFMIKVLCPIHKASPRMV